MIQVIGLLQIFGILYLLLMLYMTFLYYKRNNYSWRSFAFWVAVWSAGIVLLLFPQTSSIFTQRLGVTTRVIDFYLILGLMFFSVIAFFSFITVKRNERKVEDLVRKFALQEKKGKRRSK